MMRASKSGQRSAKLVRNRIARSTRAELIEGMRAQPGLYVDGMTYTEPEKKPYIRQGTPEYEARNDIIRRLAAEGMSDVEIGLEVNLEAQYVFTLRKRHDIASVRHSSRDRSQGRAKVSDNMRVEQLRRLRQHYGISQNTVNRALGTFLLGNWESGLGRPSEAQLDEYEMVLHRLIRGLVDGKSHKLE